MPAPSRIAGGAALVVLSCLSSALPPAAAQAVGTLSGVVQEWPDEVSPGEKILIRPDKTKLPPGGTFTIAGAVAEPQPEPPPGGAEPGGIVVTGTYETTPAGAPPPATDVALTVAHMKPEERPSPAHWTALAVTVASLVAGEPPSSSPGGDWASCAGEQRLAAPAGATQAELEAARPVVDKDRSTDTSAVGDPLPDIEIALEKAGLKGSAPPQRYWTVFVSEISRERAASFVVDEKGVQRSAGFVIDEKGVQLADDQGREPLTFAIEFAQRYAPGGAFVGQKLTFDMVAKNFYESRSNTARAADTDRPAGDEEPTQRYQARLPTADEIEVIELDEPIPDEFEPLIVAAVIRPSALPEEGQPVRQVVTVAPLRCQTPVAAPRPPIPWSEIATWVVEIPRTFKPGDPFPVRYADSSGRTVIDVPDVEGVEVVPPRPVDPRPSLTAAAEFAIAGRAVCACGNFPGPEAWNGIELDERAVSLVSASNHMVLVPLPAEMAVGRHVIAGNAAAGYTERDRVWTTVVQVGGKLDSANLMRGQSTTMELFVVGTTQPLDLQVENLSPDVIAIAGGTDQVLRTSGGDPNHVERGVDSVSRGNFNINFSLAGDRCPCGGAP
jgi:hypothetical protein